MYTSLHDSALLFGPPEGDDSEFVGVGKNILELLRILKRGASAAPSVLPAIDRPYQDWEVDLAFGFDPEGGPEACPQWKFLLDLAIFYQMTLSSVPSLTSALEGGATAANSTILSADEVQKIDFSISLFNPPTKFTVQLQHPCTLLQRHPNKLYLQPSLTHPKVLCPSLPHLRFGGAMENEILSLPTLPDFDFSLSQQHAESLLSILNCPGSTVSIASRFLQFSHFLHDSI